MIDCCSIIGLNLAIYFSILRSTIENIDDFKIVIFEHLLGRSILLLKQLPLLPQIKLLLFQNLLPF